MSLNKENESYIAFRNEVETLVAMAMSTPGTSPAEVAEQIAEMDPFYCPYDCDSCHSDECPCDRLGCEGDPL